MPDGVFLDDEEFTKDVLDLFRFEKDKPVVCSFPYPSYTVPVRRGKGDTAVKTAILLEGGEACLFFAPSTFRRAVKAAMRKGDTYNPRKYWVKVTRLGDGFSTAYTIEATGTKLGKKGIPDVGDLSRVPEEGDEEAPF